MSNLSTKVLGIVAMEPKGEYDATAYYEKLNTVTHNDSTYMALKASTGVLPTDTEYWQLIGGGVTREDTELVFNTVADMKNANLVSGLTVKTLGYYSVNDGGGALYKVRTITNDDVVDEMFIIELHDNTLIGELIYNSEINVLSLGLDGSGTNDNSSKLNNIINKVNNCTLFFPTAQYKFTSQIDMQSKNINLKGDFDTTYTTTTKGLIFSNNGFINVGRVFIEKLIIQEYNTGKTYTGLKTSGGTLIKNCTFIGFDIAINGNYKSVFVESCNIHYNNEGVRNCVDSRILNNTINANDKYGINLQSGANDNIIDSNKVEWNGIYHISMYQCVNNVISNNIFDRSTQQALRMGQVSKTTITGNLFRRNNISTTVSNDSSQIRMESCYNIIFSSNELLKGNSLDDGTGDNIPQYAMYILTSHDILSIGNSYIDSCVQADPIKQYNNTGNIEFIDLNSDISSLLKGANYDVNLNTSNTSTLSVPGKPSESNGMPILSKFNYLIRRTDTGAYEAGEIWLSNFRLWNSATSTSAKMSISSFLNGNITATITFNRDTNNYDIVFTSTSGEYKIRLVPIYI